MLIHVIGLFYNELYVRERDREPERQRENERDRER